MTQDGLFDRLGWVHWAEPRTGSVVVRERGYPTVGFQRFWKQRRAQALDQKGLYWSSGRIMKSKAARLSFQG